MPFVNGSLLQLLSYWLQMFADVKHSQIFTLMSLIIQIEPKISHYPVINKSY